MAMKYEHASLFISALALAVSGVTAWFQFRSEPDKLEVVRDQKLYTNNATKIELTGAPLSWIDGQTNSIGPVSWDITLFSPLNKTVSVVDAKVYNAADEGKVFYSGTMKFYGLLNDGDLERVPFDIPPHSARTLRLGLMVPIAPISEKPCNENGLELRMREHCLFRIGRDLFGNSVSFRSFLNGGAMAAWPDSRNMPEFLLELTTGDRTVVKHQFAYYPHEALAPDSM